MSQFEDVNCPKCGALSNATAWQCDAVEHMCHCPKCGEASETTIVFTQFGFNQQVRVTRGLVPMASALNEW